MRYRNLWLAIILGAIAYFPAAYWLSVTYDPKEATAPNVTGKKFLLQRPFRAFLDSPFAVTSIDYWFADVADVAGQYDSSSPIMIYEDEKPLGLPHSTPHTEIARLGHGRFSHWRSHHSVFVFSSSDNTDPRTNGRNYWAVKPETP
jgi:hypothetical protein